MKNYHIMVWDKYINEYIDFINKNFNRNEHIFLVIKGKALTRMNGKVVQYENVILFEDNYSSIFNIKRIISKAENVILHSLFNMKINYMLFFNKNIIRKSNWVIWGGDLYYFKYRRRSLKSNLKEVIRKRIISNLREITAIIKGDYNLAIDVYGGNAVYNYASYILPVNFDMLDKVKDISKNKSKDIYIQVGNSADKTNNHVEILHCLEKYKDNSIKILCPLSYGDKEYAREIIDLGESIFGAKFIKITNYLSSEEYSEVLSKVDIAIFNHERQQGLGNILALLYLGKKVYIRSDTTPWEYFINKNIKAYDTLRINSQTFKEFEELENNINILNSKILKQEFSNESYINMWKNVFTKK